MDWIDLVNEEKEIIVEVAGLFVQIKYRMNIHRTYDKENQH